MENARRTSQSAEAEPPPHSSHLTATAHTRRQAQGAQAGRTAGARPRRGVADPASARTRRARGLGERADPASARTRRARGGARAQLSNERNQLERDAHAMTRRQRHSPVTHTHTVARHSRSPALVASPSLQKSRITLQLALVASVALATSTCKPRGSGSRWRRARPLVARSHRPSSTLPTRAPP